MHDAEELERVGGPDDQVVVGVEARVEVEGAQAPGAQQLDHDELDIGARRVVAGVEADHRPLAQGAHVRQRRPPVGHVGVVEGGLEELVLQEQALVLAQGAVDAPQRVGEAVLTGRDRVLARVVRAIAEPHFESGGARPVHDVDAAQVGVDGLAAHRLVGVGQRAELVVVVLEDVGVDGPQFDPALGGVLPQAREVVDAVPGDVQRDPGRDPRVLVDLGRVVDLLEGVARRTRGGEHFEPCSRIAERPAGQFDRLLAQQARLGGGEVGEGGGHGGLLLRGCGSWRGGSGVRGGRSTGGGSGPAPRHRARSTGPSPAASGR